MVKTLKWMLNHFEEAFGALLIFVMAFFAFANVMSRYVINMSLNFTEELNVYFFVWLAFLGSAWAARDGSHMTVSLLYDLFPKAGRRILYVLNQGISIALFLMLGYCGVLEIIDEIALNASTETIVVPVWWFTSSIPVGSALFIIRTFFRTKKCLAEHIY